MLVLATTVVPVTAAAELPPITVPSISPEATSTLEMLTSPVPAGVKSILPLVFVLVIALPLRFRLSTCASVTALLVPNVTASTVPPLMSAVSATSASMFAVPLM